MILRSESHEHLFGALPHWLLRPGKFHGRSTYSCRGYVAMLSAHHRSQSELIGPSRPDARLLRRGFARTRRRAPRLRRIVGMAFVGDFTS